MKRRRAENANQLKTQHDNFLQIKQRIIKRHNKEGQYIDYFHSDYLNNGITFSSLSASPPDWPDDLQYITNLRNFSLVQVFGGDIYLVYYEEVFNDDSIKKRWEFFKQDGDIWQIYGNRKPFSMAVRPVAVKRITNNGSPQTISGLTFWFKKTDEQTIRIIVVTGDQLPPDGLRFFASNYDHNEFILYGEDANDHDNVGYNTYILTNEEIDNLSPTAEYTIKSYENYDNAKKPIGSPTYTETISINAKSLKVSEFENDDKWFGKIIDGPASISEINIDGEYTINFVPPSNYIPNHAYAGIYLSNDAGDRINLSKTIRLGNTNANFTIPNIDSPKRATLKVVFYDTFWRKYYYFWTITE